MSADRERVERLVADILSARARGETTSFREMAGRIALRIERDGSAQTSFVSADERAAIESALTAGPSQLRLGAHTITRDPRAHVWSCVIGKITLQVTELDHDAPAEALATLAVVLDRVLAREPAILEEAAARLDRLAPVWSTTPAAIRRALVLTTIRLSPAGPPMVYLAAGQPFGDHFVEVWLDEGGKVEDAQLAG